MRERAWLTWGSGVRKEPEKGARRSRARERAARQAPMSGRAPVERVRPETRRLVHELMDLPDGPAPEREELLGEQHPQREHERKRRMRVRRLVSRPSQDRAQSGKDHISQDQRRRSHDWFVRPRTGLSSAT